MEALIGKRPFEEKKVISAEETAAVVETAPEATQEQGPTETATNA